MPQPPMLPWWDARLAYEGDDPISAVYRRLQSRWREDELRLPPGEYIDSRTKRTRPLGSRLPDGTDLTYQLLSEEAVARARRRYPNLKAADRLRVNMLSSTPLCFSLFGHLDAFRDAAARVLSAALPWSVEFVESIEFERAPDAAARRIGGGKKDRTSFDAMLIVHSHGTRLLVGVETKYIEPFSQGRYDKDSYRATSTRPGSWFTQGAADQAVKASTNQLWRNLMLAQESEVDAGVPAAVAVVAPRTNPHARGGAEQMAKLLVEPHRRLALVSLEDIVAAALKEPSIAAWAETFSRRYLEASWADVPT
ncbi:hypothetical protein GCM10023200_19360 [Actinomycetospora chlora]|uniref:PD-(D/E)XK nuclease-like domain-containing protein n=1 Tax=Actinomycetospora chlora TaxID=663608 RepID=A0ABP9AT29_9PSEU